MTEIDVALKIYKQISKTSSPELKILEILALIGDLDVSKILEIYRDLISGKLEVIDVQTKYKLTEDQKAKIEKGVKKEIEGELIFAYEVDVDQEDLIKVKSGNKILQTNA